MNIAIVTHTIRPGDGQGRVNYEIAKYALAVGHHITILACEIAPDLLQHPQATCIHLSDPHAQVFIKGWVFAQQSFQWLNKNRTKVDVVHANGWVTWGKTDLNSVHFVHSSWLHSPVHISRVRRDLYGAAQFVFTWVNSFLERNAFGQSALIVAVSDQVKQEVRALGVPDGKITTVFNGVDLAEFHPGSAVKTDLALPDVPVLALFVGDIRSPRKNLDTVLRALTHLPGLHLAVVGRVDGSVYPALATDLGVADRVHFLDFRNDVAKIMRASDFFVFPSRYEACSLVLLEAAASGLPVITGKSTGGSEIITDESGYVLSDVENVDELAAAMKALTSDADRRCRMGAAAREIAEQHSWSTMAQQYVKLYKAVTTNMSVTDLGHRAGA